MKDSEIKEIFKIPNSTLYDWKKRDDYRKKILDFLKIIKKDEFIKIIGNKF
jgi:predicted transcriptional regulator